MTTVEPPLETGWEPETPITDTLLRQFLFSWAESFSAPVTAMGGRCLRRADIVATDMGRAPGYYNSATLLRPPAAGDFDEVLSSLEEFYQFDDGGHTGSAMLWSAWPTPDLRSRGWQLDGHPPVLLRPRGGSLPPAPAGLRIENVTDDAALRAYEHVVVHGYPFSDLLPLEPGSFMDARVLGDERLRCWVGWDGDRPVSASAVFVAAGINNVVAVATMPEARGRGFGEALTWRATLAEPDLPAMLLSSDLGRPVYERMGYLPLMRFTLWHHDRSR